MTSYCLNGTHRLCQVTWDSGLLAQLKEHFIVGICYLSHHPTSQILVQDDLCTVLLGDDLLVVITHLYSSQYASCLSITPPYTNSSDKHFIKPHRPDVGTCVGMKQSVQVATDLD